MDGNRTGAGLSSNTSRVLAPRARKSQTKGASIHETLTDLKISLAEKDEKYALEVGQWDQNFWGLIHSSYVTDKEMRVVLLDEPMLRLYRALAKTDTLFLDATGSIIKPIKSFSRILRYSLVLRHPFGAAAPLPMSEYITNEHSVESIGYFLRTIKRMENKMMKMKSDPLPCKIMMDYSQALMNAVMEVYNKETFVQYLDRTYSIIQGSAKKEDLNKTFVTICCAHVMKMVKRNVEKKGNSSQIHLAMRFMGRLINCKSLQEAEAVTRCGFIVFMSRNICTQLNAAISELERYINKFKLETDEYIAGMEGCQEDSNIISSNDIYEDTEKHSFKFSKSLISKFWRNKVLGYNELLQLEDAEKKKDTSVENKYYFPEFIECLTTNLLPTIALWSHILWGDLSKCNASYKGHWSQVINERTTNGHIERYFGLLKNPWERKLPLDVFIKRKWEQRTGFQRQFADAILTSISKGKRSRLLSVYQNNMHWLTGCSNVGLEANEVSDDTSVNQKSEAEESWMPKKGKNRQQEARYLSTSASKAIDLDPHKKKETVKESLPKRRASSGFRNFRKAVWNDLSLRTTLALVD